MLLYADGSPIQVGDSVTLEHGRTPGVVELVVLTATQMAEFGVDEPGVMLLSPPFGRVYLSEGCLQMEPLQFVAHGPPA